MLTNGERERKRWIERETEEREGEREREREREKVGEREREQGETNPVADRTGGGSPLRGSPVGPQCQHTPSPS